MRDSLLALYPDLLPIDRNFFLITLTQYSCSWIVFFLQAMFVDLKPDPIKILDIITIVRSPTDHDLGPWFYVDARKLPPFIEVNS